MFAGNQYRFTNLNRLLPKHTQTLKMKVVCEAQWQENVDHHPTKGTSEGRQF